MAARLLAIAGLRLGVRLVRLRIRRLRLACVLVVGLVVRRLGSCRRLVVRVLWFVAGVFKLAHPLANAPEQLRNALGAEEQYQHEDDEDNGLRIAEEQEGEN